MLYLKLFQTEQEKQACTETQEYVSYTVESDNVNIHYEPFFCKLTLNNGDIGEIEGSGELTPSMTQPYKATIVSAEIGNLCTSIADGTFYECASLSSITIGNSVTSIGNAAFQSCTSLTSIIIPDRVTSIGFSAFQYCSALTSVTIGNSVTSIGVGAFSSCSRLTSITMPDSVTSIGDGAFGSCIGLTSITSLATTAAQISNTTFQNVKTNGTLYVPSGSSGYDVWMQNANYYLGLYNWTKVEQ